jgi:hypothetical protein
MVACLTGSNVASSGLFDVASQGDMASMLALQQAGSTLISQLGAERRQLQEQLLERTQQHAAAAAELACLKQQLGQANATAEQRGQQVGVDNCGCCLSGGQWSERWGAGCAALSQPASEPGEVAQ